MSNVPAIAKVGAPFPQMAKKTAYEPYKKGIYICSKYGICGLHIKREGLKGQLPRIFRCGGL